MTSTSPYIAYELHRKPKHNAYDPHAWENVEITPMNPSKALKHQLEIEKCPMDIEKELAKIESKHVRLRIDRSVDKFTDLESPSGCK